MRLIFILLLFSSCVSKYSKADQKEIENFEFIAELNDSNIQFCIDTVVYKDFVRVKLFSKQNLKFDKIQILKKLTLGTQREFYFILLSDKENKIRVAKWLNKKNGRLYSRNTIQEGDLFEQSFLICEGVSGCYPNVYEQDNIKQWGCSDEVSCFINEEKAIEYSKTCKVSKTIIDFNDEN